MGRIGMLEIDGTELRLEGQPFYWQGVSFFNAIYNPSFNQSTEDRLAWLRVLKRNGVNASRLWCQWDFHPTRTFVDVAAPHTMYNDDGAIQDARFETLSEIIEASDRLGMAIELTLFSHEK